MTIKYYGSSLNPVDLNRYEAVLQTEPSACVSDKYSFIPTTRPLAVLADFGWIPTAVVQSKTRVEEKQGFQKHALRLSKIATDGMGVGETVPQIMLTNSHCGSAAFHLDVALFEKVCSNGLIVSTGSLEQVRVLHRGYTDGDVEAAIREILTRLPRAQAFAEAAHGVVLSGPERLDFAERAIEMRFEDGRYQVKPEAVLRPRRFKQSTPSLWHTFNVVQESMIRGGFYHRNAKGQMKRARKISGIDQTKRINCALWDEATALGRERGIAC